MLPGNHETHEQTRARCAHLASLISTGTMRPLGASHWAGLGYSNPTPFNTPGEYAEEEIAEALAAFDTSQPLYFVVHFPPHGSLPDAVGRGRHAVAAYFASAG